MTSTLAKDLNKSLETTERDVLRVIDTPNDVEDIAKTSITNAAEERDMDGQSLNKMKVAEKRNKGKDNESTHVLTSAVYSPTLSCI